MHLTLKERYWVKFNKMMTVIKKQENSVVLFRKLTIPTERPPLVGKVSARVPGYRSRCPGSIPGAIRFSEK
jgi:hypothetical protein